MCALLPSISYHVYTIDTQDLNGPWGGTTTSAPVAPMLQCYSGANPASVTGVSLVAFIVVSAELSGQTVAYWKGAGVPGNQLILLVCLNRCLFANES